MRERRATPWQSVRNVEPEAAPESLLFDGRRHSCDAGADASLTDRGVRLVHYHSAAPRQSAEGECFHDALHEHAADCTWHVFVDGRGWRRRRGVDTGDHSVSMGGNQLGLLSRNHQRRRQLLLAASAAPGAPLSSMPRYHGAGSDSGGWEQEWARQGCRGEGLELAGSAFGSIE